MVAVSRRTALALLVGGTGVVGVGYLLRGISEPRGHAKGPGMAGVSGAEMGSYMNMFMRHSELQRWVEEIPGGIRTTTESPSADLVAELQGHVSSMYRHLEQRAEITCMSSSLPILFRRAADYQRAITFTANGVVVVETANEPELTRAIREHAREVTGFVVEGMPAMMRGMMGNGMMRGMPS